MLGLPGLSVGSIGCIDSLGLGLVGVGFSEQELEHRVSHWMRVYLIPLGLRYTAGVLVRL